ncbi:hypothetical protein [Staphylococcus xylosus]|uniref:hypothetical protein n=1 Tax=Staphylococcus xylosus TaxID=1288 RepID=UPI002DBD8D1A|nr:hypothetical protein [Staphylococcus xylosus]MEB6229023.1 hypothetical protein [Staphylococcus xylosus]
MTFKKEMIQKLKTNKKPQDVKIIIPGVIAEIIFNKEVYKKNVELKDFTRIFEEEYADYLFKARPLLYSRLIKEFIYIDNDKDLRNYVNKLIAFLELNNDQKNKDVNKKAVKTKNSTTKSIESWGKIINPGRYNED